MPMPTIPHPYQQLAWPLPASGLKDPARPCAHPMVFQFNIFRGTWWPRPLYQEETQLFVRILRLGLEPLLPEDRTIRARPIAWLAMTSPYFADAFANGLRGAKPFQLGIDLSSTAEAMPFYFQPGFIHEATEWLAVWEWLPEPVRAAIRPKAARFWTVQDQLALAWLDCYAVTPVRPRHLPSSLRTLKDRLHTEASRARFVRLQFHTHPDHILLPLADVVLRHLSSTALDTLYADQAMAPFLPKVLGCPLASPSLVDRALSMMDLTHCEMTYLYPPTTPSPWLAQIDCAQLLRHATTTREALLALAPWAKYRLYDMPGVRAYHHPDIRHVLEAELHGPYADLVERVWKWAMPADEPFPITYAPLSKGHHFTPVKTILQDPNAPESALSHYIHLTGSHYQDLLAHPHFTAELAHRFSQREDADARRAVLDHPLLPREDRERILRQGIDDDDER